MVIVVMFISGNKSGAANPTLVKTPRVAAPQPAKESGPRNSAKGGQESEGQTDYKRRFGHDIPQHCLEVGRTEGGGFSKGRQQEEEAH